MHQLDDFSDIRLRRNCIYCGGLPNPGESTREHVPSKSLLNRPYPDNLPVVPVCRHCNVEFSGDEEYVSAFLASVVSGSTDPDPNRFSGAAKTLKHSPKLRKRIDNARSVRASSLGEPEIRWIPEIERVERVVVKIARGHMVFELGQAICDPPVAVDVYPLQLLSDREREKFEDATHAAWPEVGSRWMQRIAIGECGINGWLDVQPGVYRFAIPDGSTVRMVFREYLAAEVVWEI